MTEKKQDTPHVHHKEMMMFAEDAARCSAPWLLWEVSNDSDRWESISVMPMFLGNRRYRRKPEMLTCNGFVFRAPERVALALGETYYCPGILSKSKAHCVIWDGHRHDMCMLEFGFVHLSEEAAAKHAEALIAVSRIKES